MKPKLFRDILILCLIVVAAAFALFNISAISGVVAGVMSILLPFLLGAALAFVFSVPLRFLEGKALVFMDKKPALKRFKRAASMLILILLVALFVYVLLSLVLPEVVNSVATIVRAIPGVIRRLDEFLAPYDISIGEYLSASFAMPSTEEMNQSVGDLVDLLLRGAALGGTVIGTVYQNVISVFFTLMFTIYFLLAKERLASQADRLLRAYARPDIASETKRIAAVAKQTFSSFITGQCLEALILGGMFFLTMTLLGMPYVLLISVFIAVTALIPVVGAWIGCIAGALLILLSDPIQALWFVLLFLVLQQIEGNLVYPRVMGNAIGLPSVWVLFAVVLGQGLLGIAGMLLFIPLTSVIYTLVREHVNSRLRRREQSPGGAA